MGVEPTFSTPLPVTVSKTEGVTVVFFVVIINIKHRIHAQTVQYGRACYVERCLIAGNQLIAHVHVFIHFCHTVTIGQLILAVKPNLGYGAPPLRHGTPFQTCSYKSDV